MGPSSLFPAPSSRLARRLIPDSKSSPIFPAIQAYLPNLLQLRPVGSGHAFASGIPTPLKYDAALSLPLRQGFRFIQPPLPARPSPSIALRIPPSHKAL